MISRKEEYRVENSLSRKMPLFPEGMLFGAATAAYQIEGAAGEDGKGPSIWDHFSHRRGKIRNGDNADDACEHYTRYRDDVALMSRLGLDAYRFSVSWPRIMPSGRGAVNRKGLDFYDRLVDELMKAEIRPFLTLYHWDMPHDLFRKTGGFLSKETARYFADYAEVIVNRLGDRVKDWITLNEPWIHSVLGYMLGKHAPGLLKPVYWGRVIHNQLLSHAYAMERIKAVSPASRVGISLDIAPPYPRTNAAADRGAIDYADQLCNRVILDPLLKGEYPEMMMKRMGIFWPEVKPSELELISRPMNFLGINLYSGMKISFAPWFPFIRTGFHQNRIPYKEYIKKGKRYTAMGWEVMPDALYTALTNIRDHYGNIPVYITENGAAFTDKLADYRVKDSARVEFLAEYTAAAARAADEGCDLRGYFVWSLMDNFEWAEGFSKRFGIIHVDYETRKRTVKDSGYWFKDLINANRR